MERLYKKLESYGQSDYYPFHMPGHKRNSASVRGEFPLERDITEIEGFDNLHHPEDLLLEAQQNVAKLYGTRESFYSVNGSTAALLAAISAAVPRNGQILVARNCHKAVYHAIYLRNLKPAYIYPQMDSEWWINGGIFPDKVERCLAENPEIQAVLITSPTYDGVVSDVKEIAEIAHKYGVPLIVDEAHGAHFHFSNYFPASAAELGADLVIQSFHKTLPAMTQTAVFDYDRSKLVFSTRASLLSGSDLYHILLDRYHIQMEMESENYVLAIASVGDREEGFERLCQAIEELDQEQADLIKAGIPAEENKKLDTRSMHFVLTQMMSMAYAMEAPTEKCPLEESIGRISAEFAYLYPPGIPLITPGEQITGQFIRNMRIYMDKGLYLQGLEDYTNKTILVVEQQPQSTKEQDEEIHG